MNDGVSALREQFCGLNALINHPRAGWGLCSGSGGRFVKLQKEWGFRRY